MTATTRLMFELPGPPWIWGTVLWFYIAAGAARLTLDAYAAYLRRKLDKRRQEAS